MTKQDIFTVGSFDTSFDVLTTMLENELERREWKKASNSYKRKKSNCDQQLTVFERRFPNHSKKKEITKINEHELELEKHARAEHCRIGYEYYLSKTHLSRLDAQSFIDQEDREWNAVQSIKAASYSAKSLRKIEKFLNDWPKSEFNNRAQEKQAKVKDHIAAKKQATILKKEELEWHQATTILLLQNYISNWPKGRFVNEAGERISQLHQEDLKRRDLAAYKDASTVLEYQSYLVDWPDGTHAVKAKRAIKRLEKDAMLAREQSEWDNATTKERCEVYLTNWPEGRFREFANARIEEFNSIARINQARRLRESWEAATEDNTPESYRIFIRKWPASTHNEIAEARIKALIQATKLNRLYKSFEEPFASRAPRRELVSGTKVSGFKLEVSLVNIQAMNTGRRGFAQHRWTRSGAIPDLLIRGKSIRSGKVCFDVMSKFYGRIGNFLDKYQTPLSIVLYIILGILFLLFLSPAFEDLEKEMWAFFAFVVTPFYVALLLAIMLLILGLTTMVFAGVFWVVGSLVIIVLYKLFSPTHHLICHDVASFLKNEKSNT